MTKQTTIVVIGSLRVNEWSCNVNSQTIWLYVKRLNKTESPIFVLLGGLCFRNLLELLFYFTAAGFKCMWRS